MMSDIKKNAHYFFSLVAVLLMSSNVVYAQSSFDRFKQQQKEELSHFKTDRNQSFADYISKSWRSFAIESGINPPIRPKPNTPKTLVTSKKPNINTRTLQEDKSNTTLSPADNNGGTLIDFYGKNIVIDISKHELPALKNNNEDGLGLFWQAYTENNFKKHLKSLLNARHELELNDWAYYLLLKKTAQKLYENTNSRNSWIFFMLNQSGISAKIGQLENQNFCLLLPSLQQIYQTPFTTINEQKYYILDAPYHSKISTFQNNFDGATSVVNLASDYVVSPEFKTKSISKSITFDYENQSITINIPYDAGQIALYNDMPIADLKVFFGTKMNTNTYEALYSQIKPLVEKKSKLEAVSFLLAFVQFGFLYQKDEEQFGHEKFFYPEETIAYPYSDCEDRAILFARLVKDILNMNIIGIKYPNHVATAILFEKSLGGDSVEYKNQTYIVCDPTYIGADVGQSMPEFKNTKVEIVEF